MAVTKHFTQKTRTLRNRSKLGCGVLEAETAEREKTAYSTFEVTNVYCRISLAVIDVTYPYASEYYLANLYI
jgi:hypothetical protein